MKNIKKIAEEILLDMPANRQTFNYDCGAKAVQTILAYYGYNIREDSLLKVLDTSEKEGTRVVNIINTLKKFNLDISYKQNMTIEELKDHIRKKHPVMLPIQAWTDVAEKDEDWRHDWEDGHYVIAIGIKDDKIIFNDPSQFTKGFIPEEQLDLRWHDYDDDGKVYEHFGIIFEGEPEFDSSMAKYIE